MIQSVEGTKESRTRVSERGFFVYGIVALRPSSSIVHSYRPRSYLHKVILRDNLN